MLNAGCLTVAESPAAHLLRLLTLTGRHQPLQEYMCHSSMVPSGMYLGR